MKTVIFEEKYSVNIKNFKTVNEIDKFIEKTEKIKLNNYTEIDIIFNKIFNIKKVIKNGI